MRRLFALILTILLLPVAVPADPIGSPPVGGTGLAPGAINDLAFFALGLCADGQIIQTGASTWECVYAPTMDSPVTTDNAITRFDGVVGKIQSSLASLSDFGAAIFPGSVTTPQLASDTDLDVTIDINDNEANAELVLRNSDGITVFSVAEDGTIFPATGVSGLQGDSGGPTTGATPTIAGGNDITTSVLGGVMTIDYSGNSGLTGITADSGGTAVGPTVDLAGDNGLLTVRDGNEIKTWLGGTTPINPDPAIGINWPTRNPDDVPGIADGAGADPDPIPWDRSSEIFSGVLGVPFTNEVDWIHCVSGYNSKCQSRLASGNYGASQSIEYSYDAGDRSGSEKIEWHFAFVPATLVVTFASGTGTIFTGDNITFSGGEVCRPTVAEFVGVGSTLRVTCALDDAPDPGDTITGGCAACTGTVSGTPVVDLGYAPWSLAIDTRDATTSTNLSMKRDAGGTYYAWTADASNRWLSLGWGGAPNTPDASYASRVSIPAFPDLGAHGGKNAHPYFAGDHAFDTTSDSTIGTQLVYAGTTGGPRHVLVPTDTDAILFNNVSGGVASININLPWGHYQPVTITALACRNDSTITPTTPATLKIETITGATIAETVTCVGKSAALAWTTTVAPNAIDPTGIRVDVLNIPEPANDSHTIYVARVSTFK